MREFRKRAQELSASSYLPSMLEQQSEFPRYNMKSRGNVILNEIFHVVSHFPCYISCYIAEVDNLWDSVENREFGIELFKI